MSRRKIQHLSVAGTVAVLATLAFASPASAAIPGVPEGSGADNGPAGDITCAVQVGTNAGERHCSGLFTTFDGAPIDINVGFPPAPASGPDGDFPIVGIFHGWGGSKIGLTSGTAQEWLNKGYAVFSMSDRGWGMSCGATDAKRLTPACANGYNHLLDTRYEVRDAQEIFEALADRAATGATAGEGLIHPQQIGAMGDSYGGGMSMALGALKNRKMVGGEQAGPVDGTLVPWVSDGDKNMEIAAVQPNIPWTDLAYSLAPNGATLDYVADAPYRGPNGGKRIGVLKQSFVAGLYGLGAASSNYPPPGTDPDADLTQWYAEVNAGEPYDGNPAIEDLIEELTLHHSSYYIDDSESPAPMLISNGWTDDLFPPDEAIRFYNRTRTEHPATPISLMFTDHGHQRGQNKGPDSTFRNRRLHEWFDHYVKGVGPEPFQGVQTLTQTCGSPSGGATGAFDDPNTDQPFRASTWAAIGPREVRHTSADLQVIAPSAGSPQAGQAYDPVAAGNNPCRSASATDIAGNANYRLPAAPAGGYTLMGSPTVIADFFSPGANSQVAARLVDVAPDNTQTLVARGLWRPDVNVGTASSRLVFQLHPNGWHFAEGHIPKLELLPHDQPYARNSNGQAPVTVRNLELRLPVLEQPGGPVQSPAGKVVPPNYELARDFQSAAGGDADNDGWPDDTDNCPSIDNDNQLDSDGDGIGDACDDFDNDTDDDGVDDAEDNCVGVSNPTQTDSDGDGEGDLCDANDNQDPDGDGRDNDVDNCDDVSNPGQEDTDGDGVGNACDTTNNLDLDEDGVEDAGDNCVGTPNGGQQDSDGDGVGNACDPQNDLDRDDDGIANGSDNCPDNGNTSQNDGDGDGIGDACDPTDDDPDRDGQMNGDDNCPQDSNPGQQNSDTDAEGDMCDADDDNDGIADSADACRTQAGMDSDGCPVAAPGGSGGKPQPAVCTNLLMGSPRRDQLDGTAAGDRLLGRAGNDVLRGLGAADCLSGNRGRDRISAGAGADVVSGGRHDDVIDVADGEADTVNCGRGRDQVTADAVDALRRCESVFRS